MIVLDMEAKGLEAKTCGSSVTINNGGKLMVRLEVEPRRVNIARGEQAVTVYRDVAPLLAADCAEVAETEHGYKVQVFGMTFGISWLEGLTRVAAKSGEAKLFSASRYLREWEREGSYEG